MPSTPKTAAYIKSLERDSKRLSATLRYHQRKFKRDLATLNNTILSLYEENKALSGEKKAAINAKSLHSAKVNTPPKPSHATKVHTPSKLPSVAKSRFHLKPEDRRPRIASTDILLRPGNPPIFGSAIDEYGTNVGSELFL